MPFKSKNETELTHILLSHNVGGIDPKKYAFYLVSY